MQPICYDNYYWQNDLVRLRAGTPEDWERAYGNLFDSEARRVLQYEIELPPVAAVVQEGCQKGAGFHPESGRLMFTVETLDGIAVGGLGLDSIDSRNGTFHIGIQVDVGQRGKGYGTAAMRILLGYAFFERRLNKFNCTVLETNPACLAMMKKLGCVQEGVRRQTVYTDGRYMDEVLIGLTKDEFVASEKRAAEVAGRKVGAGGGLGETHESPHRYGGKGKHMEHKEYRKLHAEWYEYMSGDKSGGPEIAFWLCAIAEAGQPVLELGSGTGAVLIPLLAKGIDVTGIDTSEDMIARCREICQAKGLKPQLHEQSMLDFSLPRQFALAILPSGSLSLFTKDQDIRAMFGRVLAHLRPGGTFVYGFEPIPEKPGENNDQWRGGWTRGPGDIVIAWRRHWRHDAEGRTWECLFIVEKFVGGRLVETEANERTGRNFSAEEAMDYARTAGFEDVRVIEAWAPDRSPVVLCRKPA